METTEDTATAAPSSEGDGEPPHIQEADDTKLLAVDEGKAPSIVSNGNDDDDDGHDDAAHQSPEEEQDDDEDVPRRSPPASPTLAAAEAADEGGEATAVVTPEPQGHRPEASFPGGPPTAAANDDAEDDDDDHDFPSFDDLLDEDVSNVDVDVEALDAAADDDAVLSTQDVADDDALDADGLASLDVDDVVLSTQDVADDVNAWLDEAALTGGATPRWGSVDEDEEEEEVVFEEEDGGGEDGGGAVANGAVDNDDDDDDGDDADGDDCPTESSSIEDGAIANEGGAIEDGTAKDAEAGAKKLADIEEEEDDSAEKKRKSTLTGLLRWRRRTAAAQPPPSHKAGGDDDVTSSSPEAERQDTEEEVVVAADDVVAAVDDGEGGREGGQEADDAPIVDGGGVPVAVNGYARVNVVPAAAAAAAEKEPDFFIEAFVAGGTKKPPPPAVSLPRTSSELISALPLSPTAWSTSYTDLIAYEWHRRSSYQLRLSQCSLYWRSNLRLLRTGISQTKRAERTLRGSAEFATRYAEFHRAAGQDMLDECGLPRKQPTSREKRIMRRGVRSSSGSGVSGSGGRDVITVPMPSPEKKDDNNEDEAKMGEVVGGTAPPSASDADERGTEQSSEEEPSSSRHSTRSSTAKQDPAKQEEEPPADDIFGPLYQSQSVMAEQFVNFATYVTNISVAEVTKIHNDLVPKIDALEEVGNTILEELEAAEAEVVKAWENYFQAAEEALKPANLAVEERRRGASLSDCGKPGAADAPTFVEECRDEIWVREMRYRMDVAFLSSCWEKSAREMTNLFTAFKRFECERRVRLSELATAYLEKQRELWSSLPRITASVLEGVADVPLDPGVVEDDVRASIRIGAQSIQKEEGEMESKVTLDAEEEEGREEGAILPALEGINPHEGIYDLLSPLMSDLTVKADLIEVRGSGGLGGLMSSWRTVLAVVTANSFLHIFDLPPETKLSKDAGPEFAFHALVPTVEVAGEGSTRVANLGRQIKDWHKAAKPFDSFALPNCSVSFKEVKNDHLHQTLEITEQVQGIVKTSTRRMLMRVQSKDEEKAWISAIKANK